MQTETAEKCAANYTNDYSIKNAVNLRAVFLFQTLISTSLVIYNLQLEEKNF